MPARFVIRERRGGWRSLFYFGYTHVVVDTEIDAIICASPEHGCEVVAEVMNAAFRAPLRGRTSSDRQDELRKRHRTGIV